MHGVMLLGMSYAIVDNLVQNSAMSMFFTPNCSEFISLSDHIDISDKTQSQATACEPGSG
jgi:hypothetical protein